MRRLRRSQGERTLLEGPHLVEEAVSTGLEMEAVVATPQFLGSAEARNLVPRLARPPLEIAPRLLDDLTDADSPRGIVAIARLPAPPLDALPRSAAGVYVYADGLQDPGNLGAIARVAEASGVVGLCLGPGSVRRLHPRSLRASAGSLLRVPTFDDVSLEALDAHLAPLRPRWATLVTRGGVDLWSTDLDGPLILVVGAEGRGVSPEALARADLRLTIAMTGRVESLNAAVSTAVVLFEARRRRVAD